MIDQKMGNTQNPFENLTLIQQATVHNVINHLLLPETSFFGQEKNEYVSLQCYFCHELFLTLEILEQHEMTKVRLVTNLME